MNSEYISDMFSIIDFINNPLLTFHILIDLSKEHEYSKYLFRLKTMDYINFVCF